MRIKFSILFLIFSSSLVMAANENENEYENKRSKEKNNTFNLTIVNNSLNELYDSINIWWSIKNVEIDSIAKVNPSKYPKYTYKRRIEVLNDLTPIRLEYNEHVHKYIEAYAVKNPKKLESIISKSSYYFPIFEEYLAKYDLPLELKYLAAVESALDANAISKSGAVGLWQIMKPTADILGLKITSYIDERRDVHKSTDAACRYLKHLYQIFGDWQMALAAYNGGPGTLTKAIAKSGGLKNYWQVRPYMTDQMQNYVPAFIAMNYLMHYQSFHGIYPEKYFFESLKTDSIYVEGPLYLKNIAEVTGTDIELIKELNPVFIHAFVPKDGTKYPIILPNDCIISFIENMDEAYNYNPSDSVSVTYVENTRLDTVKNRSNIIYYDVVSGDSLFKIALKYDCLVQDIREWNNLNKEDILRIGDKLKIYVE